MRKICRKAACGWLRLNRVRFEKAVALDPIAYDINGRPFGPIDHQFITSTIRGPWSGHFGALNSSDRLQRLLKRYPDRLAFTKKPLNHKEMQALKWLKAEYPRHFPGDGSLSIPWDYRLFKQLRTERFEDTLGKQRFNAIKRAASFWKSFNRRRWLLAVATDPNAYGLHGEPLGELAPQYVSAARAALLSPGPLMLPPNLLQMVPAGADDPLMAVREMFDGYDYPVLY